MTPHQPRRSCCSVFRRRGRSSSTSTGRSRRGTSRPAAHLRRPADATVAAERTTQWRTPRPPRRQRSLFLANPSRPLVQERCLRSPSHKRRSHRLARLPPVPSSASTLGAIAPPANRLRRRKRSPRSTRTARGNRIFAITDRHLGAEPSALQRTLAPRKQGRRAGARRRRHRHLGQSRAHSLAARCHLDRPAWTPPHPRAKPIATGAIAAAYHRLGLATLVEGGAHRMLLPA